MGIGNFFSAVTTGLQSRLKKTLDTFNMLEAVDGSTFVAKDGSLMTLIRIDGAKKMMGPSEMKELLERADTRFSPLFRDVGHALQFWFMRDPDSSATMLRAMLRPPQDVASALNMNLDDVFEERARILPRHVVQERSFIALWTRLSILSPRDLQKMNLMGAAPPVWPRSVDTQYPFLMGGAMRVRHDAFVGTFRNALDEFNIRSTVMGPEEALQVVRGAMYPDLDDSSWRPSLSGGMGRNSIDGKSGMHPPRAPEFGPNDISHLLWPRIDDQIFPKGAKTLDGTLVRVGDRIFSGIDMTIGPQNVTIFNDLLNRLRNMGEFPWRASFLMEGDGLRGMGMRRILASIVGFSNQENRMLKEAINALTAHKLEGGVVVKLRVSFATWGPSSDPGLAEERASRLQRAVEGWGYSGAAPSAGDPLDGVMSSALGIHCTSTAVAGAMPLRDAVSMMPWDRDASPFQDGSVLFRTRDGRPWPYQPGSPKQATWIDLVYGPPGKGKSVWLNTTNLSFCLSASATSGMGGAQLPRVGIIDIGMSSAGLISLLRESLPADRQDEVLFRKLRMNKADAINPFDTPLGLRSPLTLDKAFLENFMLTLCTDPGKDIPSGLAGLVGRVIDEVYKQYSDQEPTGTPKIYSPGTEPKVDEAIARAGLAVRSNMTWWSVVDSLFNAGHRKSALLAQRHAVPVLDDLPAIASSTNVEDIYGDKTVDGEPILKMFSRLISESLRAFPILQDVTRLDFGNARVVSLDLQDAAPSGGQNSAKQTALVYMLARFMLGRDYYINTDDLDADLNMAKPYRLYHREVVQRLRETPKRLVLDEFHRTATASAVRAQVVRDMREGRKWGVQIVLASQLLDDFDEDMLSLGTGFWIMGCTTDVDRKKAATRFNLSNSAQGMLQNLNGPSKEWGGAPFLAVLAMDDGSHEHLLINTLGPIELWAFSTTSDDVQLRNRLYERLGPSLARSVLARRFPGGSAKDEIERRKQIMSGRGVLSDEQQAGVIATLAEELSKAVAGS